MRDVGPVAFRLPTPFPAGVRMAFWDFLPKLFRGGRKPEPTTAPAPRPAPAPGPTPGPAAPAPRAEPVPVSSPAPTSPPPAPAAEPLPGGPKPGDFLPIGRDDLLKQGEEARRTGGWMWFGRRDLIPPTSDPRTLLIDRGM